MAWKHVLTSALLLTGALPAPQAQATLDAASWIWFNDGDPAQSVPAATRYLRRTFTAPGGPFTEAQLTVAGDDTADVWLNDTYLAGSARGADSWKQAQRIDLTAALKPGAENTLLIAARNTTAGPAGVLGHVSIVGNSTLDLVTDASWQAAATVPQTWSAARVAGRYGAAPWNRDVRPPRADGTPLSIGGLITERRDNPLGIDTQKPRFGWKLAAARTQGRYRITVGTTPAATGLWDSGEVASGDSVDVAYGGPPLTSNTTYHWRVRVWDVQGRSAESEPARFDTGLFDPGAEWQADFVGGPAGANVDGASWIWYPEGDPAVSVPAGERFFRRTVDLTGPATLAVTGDDTADVWVNGVRVSTSRRVTDSWKRATTVDISEFLRDGPDTIAVSAVNSSAGPAGLLLKLSNGTVSDASWKTAQSGPAGWEQPGFDDGGWSQARATGVYGAGPWGTQVSVPNPAPYLSKGFDVTKPVARARLFVTALGLHDTYVNGTKVGPERLSPGWTDYTKRVPYRVYDLTGNLKSGANTLGALVGNGWYSGNIGFAGSQRYGTRPWYSARLAIEYTDGTRADVGTDDTWTTQPSAITADDLYHGEDQDARVSGTAQPVTVRTGPQPPLVAQVDPGVTVQQEFRPVSITQPKPGVFVADLGQNVAGWNRLTATGPAGTRITVRHAEILNADGTIYTANLRAAQATDTFTLNGVGGQETFEPHFTVHGYRYVEITGYPGTPTADSLTGRAAWTDGEQSGTFTTSDPMLNQVQHNILWGTRSNMLSIPTDCPQRDERLGWTGDIAAFAATSVFNVDDHGLLTKFADDMVDAQRADGAFTDVAPAVITDAGRAGWGDAGVIVPYTLWQRYGDLRPADKHFDAMARWVDYLRSTSGPDLIRDQWTHGDWLHAQDPTAQDITSTAFFGWSARLVSRMAAATGRTAQASEYAALADRIGAAFTTRFVAADGTIGSNSQTGYVLALAFGLVPPDREQAVADKLAAAVAARNGHLSVGFMGVENLLPVLAAHGHLDTAYRVLQQPDYPGWGYMNSRGATTIWERWDGIRPDGSLQTPDMNSFNHYGLGSVGDWLYRSVGGLAPSAPGYRQILIAPQPGGTLTSASSALETPYGAASSSWRRSGGRLTLDVVIPPNTSATVRLPGATSVPAEAVAWGAGEYRLPPGAYTFTV